MEKKVFSNITLLSVNGLLSEEVNLNCIKALLYSSKNLEFKHTKFLTAAVPDKKIEGIEFIKINTLSYQEYSNFIIKNLYDYVDTEFVLLIQDDGFVINPEFWDDEFLNFDYIGAMWRDVPDVFRGVRVGNGGFSLRSKKLLKIAKENCPAVGINEDVSICVYHRNIFTNNNIKFAPMRLAKKFSFETHIDEYPFLDYKKTFGFHGKSYKDCLDLLKTIKI